MAVGYGLGFALNEKGNKKYAIVVACGSEATEVPLAEAFSTLYNGGFNGILMQNYRAVYAKNEPATTEMKLRTAPRRCGFPAHSRPTITARRWIDRSTAMVSFMTACRSSWPIS